MLLGVGVKSARARHIIYVNGATRPRSEISFVFNLHKRSGVAIQFATARVRVACMVYEYVSVVFA